MVAPCAGTETVTGPQPVAVHVIGSPSVFPPDHTSSTVYMPAASAITSARLRESIATADFGLSVSMFSMQLALQVTDLLTL